MWSWTALTKLWIRKKEILRILEKIWHLSQNNGFCCHHVMELLNLSIKLFVNDRRTCHTNTNNWIVVKLLDGAHFRAIPPLLVRLPYFVNINKILASQTVKRDESIKDKQITHNSYDNWKIKNNNNLFILPRQKK